MRHPPSSVAGHDVASSSRYVNSLVLYQAQLPTPDPTNSNPLDEISDPNVAIPGNDSPLVQGRAKLDTPLSIGFPAITDDRPSPANQQSEAQRRRATLEPLTMGYSRSPPVHLAPEDLSAAWDEFSEQERRFWNDYSCRGNLGIREFYEFVPHIKHESLLKQHYTLKHGTYSSDLPITGSELSERLWRFLRSSHREYMSFPTGNMAWHHTEQSFLLPWDWTELLINCFLDLHISPPPSASLVEEDHWEDYGHFRNAHLAEQGGREPDQEGFRARLWMVEMSRKQASRQAFRHRPVPRVDSLESKIEKATSPFQNRKSPPSRPAQDNDAKSATIPGSRKRKASQPKVADTGYVYEIETSRAEKPKVAASACPDAVSKAPKSRTGLDILLAHIRAFYNSKTGENQQKYDYASLGDVRLPKLGSLIDNRRIPVKPEFSGALPRQDPPDGYDAHGNPAMTKTEKELCKLLKITWGTYQRQKLGFFLAQAIIFGVHDLNDAWPINLGRSQAQQLGAIDVKHTSTLWAHWERWGWVADSKTAASLRKMATDDLSGNVREAFEGAGIDIDATAKYTSRGVFNTFGDAKYARRCMQQMVEWEQSDPTIPRIASKGLDPKAPELQGVYTAGSTKASSTRAAQCAPASSSARSRTLPAMFSLQSPGLAI